MISYKTHKTCNQLLKQAVDKYYGHYMMPQDQEYWPEPEPSSGPTRTWGDDIKEVLLPYRDFERAIPDNSYDNKKKWMQPEGTSSHWGITQPLVNSWNWLKSTGYDIAEGLDDYVTYPLFSENWFHDPTKKPKNYVKDFGDIFDIKPYSNPYYGYDTDWAKVRTRENIRNQRKFEQGRTPLPQKRNGGTLMLPESEIFNAMALEEAKGRQYDRLRDAGWTIDNIRDYILTDKYLPLIRHVTGQKSFPAKMQLTPEQMSAVKDQMITRQLDGLRRNLAYRPSTMKMSEPTPSGLYSRAQEDDYRKVLGEAFDKRVEALKNGDTPTTDGLTYTDYMKKHPALINALKETSKNVW